MKRRCEVTGIEYKLFNAANEWLKNQFKRLGLSRKQPGSSELQAWNMIKVGCGYNGSRVFNSVPVLLCMVGINWK